MIHSLFNLLTFFAVSTAGYYYEGFLAIQRAVDLGIIAELSGLPVSATATTGGVDIQLKSFPYPPYLKDNFIVILQTQLPFIIMISFIITAPTFCKDVVLEKEKKLKVRLSILSAVLFN
jgi:ATP-binding cassette, subfamily A (ABC1), member 3